MKRRLLIIGVASLLAILAVGLTVFVRFRKDAQRLDCLNNLRMLAAPMICCVPMANNLNLGDKLDPSQVCQFFKAGVMPECPAGGAYQVTWIVGASNPTCSVHGDLLWEAEGVRTLAELSKKDDNK